MGALMTRPKEIREQTSRILRAAEKIAGNREALADALGVQPYLVAEWIAGLSDAPDQVVARAVEMIVEQTPPYPARGGRGARPTDEPL